MQIKSKTINKIYIEIEEQELREKSFDLLWDEIRKQYPEKIYKTHKIREDKNNKIILIILEKNDIVTILEKSI